MNSKTPTIDQKITVYDTTLRDGDQAGAWFSPPQKVVIARALDNLGIDVIEAGFANDKALEMKGIKDVAASVRRPIICALALCTEQSILAAVQALENAEHARIHLYKASAPGHLDKVFHQSQQEYLDQIAESIEYAKRYFDDIQYSAEAATSTPREFLTQIGTVAHQAGANTFNVPDTYGVALPHEIADLFTYLSENIPGVRADTLTMSTHNHDDLGVATMNSVAALQAIQGKKQVEGTINGIGERAGNGALEEIMLLLHKRKDMYPQLNIAHIRMENFVRTSAAVSQLSGITVSRNKTGVGAGLAVRGTGSHVDAERKIGDTHDAYSNDIPALMGHPKATLELSGSSGKAVVQEFAEELKLSIPPDQLVPFAKVVIDFADAKRGSSVRTVTPDEFFRLFHDFFTHAES